MSPIDTLKIETLENAQTFFIAQCNKKVSQKLLKKIINYTGFESDIIVFFAKLIETKTESPQEIFKLFEQKFNEINNESFKVVNDNFPKKDDFEFIIEKESQNLIQILLEGYKLKPVTINDGKVIFAIIQSHQFNYYEEWLFKTILVRNPASYSIADLIRYPRLVPYDMDINETASDLAKKGLLHSFNKKDNSYAFYEVVINAIIHNYEIKPTELKHVKDSIKFGFTTPQHDDADFAHEYAYELHSITIVTANQHYFENFGFLCAIANRFLELKAFNKAKYYYKRAIKCTENSKYKEHLLVTQCLFYYALTLHLLEELEESEKWMLKIRSIYKNVFSPYLMPLKFYKSRLEHSEEHYFDKEGENFNNQFKVAFLENQYLTFTYFYVAAFLGTYRGGFDEEPLENCFQLLEAFQGNFSVDRKYEYLIQNLVAYNYRQYRSYESCAFHYRNALKIIGSYIGDDTLDYAIGCSNLAYALLLSHQNEEAVSYYKLAFELFVYHKVKEVEILTFSYFGYAKALFYEEKYEESYQNFEKHLTIAPKEADLERHIFLICKSYRFLAKINIKRKNFDLAESQLNELIAYAEENKIVLSGIARFYREEKGKAYEILSFINFEKRDFSKFKSYFKKAILMLSRTYGASNTRMKRYWINYANNLLEFGKVEEAVKIRYKVVMDAVKQSGIDADHCIKMHNDFVEFLDYAKQYKAAEIVTHNFEIGLNDPYKSRDYVFVKIYLNSATYFLKMLQKKDGWEASRPYYYENGMNQADKCLVLLEGLFDEDHEEVIAIKKIIKAFEDFDNY